MNSRFQISQTGQKILLGVAIVLLGLTLLSFVSGVPVLLPVLAVGALAAGGGYALLRERPAPRHAAILPFPGTARTASGGVWEVVDPHQLIAAPQTRHEIRVTFQPDETFIATSLRAVLRATETWWEERNVNDMGQAPSQRTRRVSVLAELPAHLDGPLSFEAGKTETWDLVFALDGNAPCSGGDPDFLSCEWLLEFTVARRLRFDAVFVQPVIVAQPTARLNAGVIEESEFSRAQESTSSSASLAVGFVVRPTPLDLAAPAHVELSIRNGGVPISGNGVRLEVYVRGRSFHGDAREWILWAQTRQISPLPLGVTQLQYDLPCISRPIADMDLPHGWYRGAMRFIVAIPYGPDLVVGRDLCLSFDKPPVPPPAYGTAGMAAGPAPVPAVRASTPGVDRPLVGSSDDGDSGYDGPEAYDGPDVFRGPDEPFE